MAAAPRPRASRSHEASGKARSLSPRLVASVGQHTIFDPTSYSFDEALRGDLSKKLPINFGTNSNFVAENHELVNSLMNFGHKCNVVRGTCAKCSTFEISKTKCSV